MSSFERANKGKCVMKKIKYIYWILSVLLFAFYACSTESVDTIKLLKRVVTTSSDGASTSTMYTYIGSKIVSIDGVLKHTDFTYDNDLITKIVVFDKQNQLSESIECSYVGGQLVQVKSLNNYRISYVYNLNGTISFEKFILDSDNPEVKVSHGTLYFQNENLIKTETIADDTPEGTISTSNVSFEYDSKNNPMRNVLGYRKLLDQNQKISLNNSLTSVLISTTTQGDQVTSSAKFYKTAFKYDVDDYPIEEVSETAILDNGTIGYLKTDYFYQ